ncbi:sulfotransferase family 2 domain-containing protein [Synechococcus sp. ROS8604]|uniref:sulfotransferase family 2 domain-containing protein n=1 Tax=Synechococcus sp. ROS8604 TaxID=1442557 RepID=UPI00164619A6
MPKAGGTYLRSQLNNYLNVYIDDWHEIKLHHLNSRQKAIVCLRDPIKRFESAFYSKLHMKQNLNNKESELYMRYPDVNEFTKELIANPSIVQKYCWGNRSVPMLSRYSRLSYWFGSIRQIKKNRSKILNVIRTEYIDLDLKDIYDLYGIVPDNIKWKKNKKPESKYPKLSESNINYLKSYLAEEYQISNYLLSSFNKHSYSNTLTDENRL